MEGNERQSSPWSQTDLRIFVAQLERAAANREKAAEYRRRTVRAMVEAMSQPKPDIALKSKNHLFTTQEQETEKETAIRDLCLLLHISFADEIKVETLPWGDNNLGLVFYSGYDWIRRVSFDRPEILQIVQEKGLNVAVFLRFVIQGRKLLDGNEILAISNPDKITRFLADNQIVRE